MVRYKVGLIRVVTIKDKDLLNLHARVIEKALPELQVFTRCIQQQPKGIYNTETEEMAIPKIVDLARQMEEEGEAIIISCAADPAVEEARRTVSIPVVGAGSAAAALALSYDRRIGVLNLTEKIPLVIEETLKDHIVAQDHPHGVMNTLDLLTDDGMAAVIEAAQRLERNGARVIALACTGMATIRIAPFLEEKTGLAVIDPVIASGVVALHALKRQRV